MSIKDTIAAPRRPHCVDDVDWKFNSQVADNINELAAWHNAYDADSTLSDQGAVDGKRKSVAYIAQTVGTSTYAVIALRHDPRNGATTTYTWDTSLDLTAYPYLYVYIEPGAVLDRTTGDEVLTVYSPENILKCDKNALSSSDMIKFSNHYSVGNLIKNGNFLSSLSTGETALTATPTYSELVKWYAFQNSSANGITAQDDSGISISGKCIKIGRNSGATETGAIGFQQAIDSVDSIPMAGRKLVLSFFAKVGANYSGGQVNCAVLTGTAEDEGVANMGSWTGVTAPIGDTITLTTSFVRYQLTGTIAAGAKEIGVRFYYTPAGTAGVDDNLYITGVRLEDGEYPSNVDNTTRFASDIIVKTPFVACGRFSNFGPSDPFAGAHFIPFNGNSVIIDDRIETIPVGSLSSSGGAQTDYENCYLDGVASQTLVNGTFYFAYAAMLNGVMIIDWSTTGPATDPRNGVQIKTGDPTRSLIGLAYIKDVSGTLTTYGGARGQTVASLFNPFDWVIETTIAGPTTATTATALSGGATLPNGQPTYNLVEWVQFYFRPAKIKFWANSGHSVDGSQVVLGMGINSTSVISGFSAKSVVYGTANESVNLAGASPTQDNMGYNYVQAIGNSDTAGTTQFTGVLRAEVQTP